MGEPVIVVSALTRRFGARTALASVSLSVPRGGVYGLVGANGAGKTTLIKHVLGLLRAESGSVRVFGLDPVAEPVGVLSRIGYLSEDNDIPGWMRVDELIRYSRAFYPAWDDVYAEELRQAFALEPSAKIKTLSKGQKARAGLLSALAHRPELLVLDEPSSGLDPIVRRDILGAILRTIADEGRTVLFSSHLLEEVEQVADHVTMISQGEIVLSAPLRAIKERHLCLSVRFAQERQAPPAAAGVLRWAGAGCDWTAFVHGGSGELQAAAAVWQAHIVAERVPSLAEIFLAHVGSTVVSGPEA
jgi:ABC-2 type transport system ATP-binding protein